MANSDTTVATLGVRHGITGKAEIYGRFSGLTSVQRGSGPEGSTRNRESGFGDAWLGLNYQFKNDDTTPAVLGFAEFSIYEKHRTTSANFKSAMVGMTIYKAIDPVIFSLTGACRVNQNRKSDASSYQPGNLLLVNPNMAFAVNDRVTLLTGLQWTRRSTDRYDGKPTGISRTGTDFLLGVGYGISNENAIDVSIKVNASGRNGAELRVGWLYTL